MKLTFQPSSPPAVILNAPEKARLRAAAALFDELAFKGRAGAVLGGIHYSSDHLGDLAEMVRDLLESIDQTTGKPAANAQEPAPRPAKPAPQAQAPPFAPLPMGPRP